MKKIEISMKRRNSFELTVLQKEFLWLLWYAGPIKKSSVSPDLLEEIDRLVFDNFLECSMFKGSYLSSYLLTMEYQLKYSKKRGFYPSNNLRYKLTEVGTDVVHALGIAG